MKRSIAPAVLAVLALLLAGCSTAPTAAEPTVVETVTVTEVVTETVTETATEVVTEVVVETVTATPSPSPTPVPAPAPALPDPAQEPAVVEPAYDHQCPDGTWRPDAGSCPASTSPGLGYEPDPNDGEGGVPGAIDTAPGYDEESAAHDEAVGDMVCPGPGCAVGG